MDDGSEQELPRIYVEGRIRGRKISSWSKEAGVWAILGSNILERETEALLLANFSLMVLDCGRLSSFRLV